MVGSEKLEEAVTDGSRAAAHCHKTLCSSSLLAAPPPHLPFLTLCFSTSPKGSLVVTRYGLLPPHHGLSRPDDVVLSV